eukprot:GHVN01025157.1.p1 GENE.GHVN01025157.1~~GHVN01025157.1.p1  ORF type:complete len:134 (+),score=29.19 GHVN01025157.1:76-477(+)
MWGLLHELLFWRNLVTTGSALGVANTSLILVFLLGWPVVRLVCYGAMMVIEAGFLLSCLFPKQEVTQLYEEGKSSSPSQTMNATSSQASSLTSLNSPHSTGCREIEFLSWSESDIDLMGKLVVTHFNHYGMLQ